MKKVIYILLMLLLLSGCEQELNETTQTAEIPVITEQHIVVTETPLTLTPPTIPKLEEKAYVYSFDGFINIDDTRHYRMEYCVDEGFEYNVYRVMLFDANNEHMQTLYGEFHFGYVFDPKFEDLNTDGYTDISLPYGSPDHFRLYLWNNDVECFESVIYEDHDSSGFHEDRGDYAICNGYLEKWIKLEHNSFLYRILAWDGNVLKIESEEFHRAIPPDDVREE